MSSRSWSLGRSALFAVVAVAAAALVNQMVGCMSAAAQARTSVPTAADELIERMSLQARVIFAGRVAAVRRPIGPAGAAEGVFEIDFLVEEAVRGVAPGSIYTLREWAGLWGHTTQRYRIGQRLLMFLHDPLEGGFGSTVHGPEGAIRLRGSGRAPGPDDSGDEAAELAVDLRWVQAQVVTARGEHLGSFGGPVRAGSGPIWRPPHGIRSEGGMADDTLALAREFPGPWVGEPPPVEAQTQPLSQVLELCRRSVRIRDAPR